MLKVTISELKMKVKLYLEMSGVFNCAGQMMIHAVSHRTFLMILRASVFTALQRCFRVWSVVKPSDPHYIVSILEIDVYTYFFASTARLMCVRDAVTVRT